jgi:pyrroline-5-carboxylate reductase
MGGALLKGWIAEGLAPERVFIQDPSIPGEMAEYCSTHGITVAASPALPEPPAVILIAVKPQVMDTVLPTVAPQAGENSVVVSVAAGRTIASLAAHFKAGTAIIRVMPNTPAAVGRGISALYANDAVQPEQAKLCETLMAAVGETVWLDSEALIDAVTAVSGSGPAYVFLLAECLAEAGKIAGLPDDLADKLARATVSGAGELLHQSDLPPEQLRRNVTSPGGTTAAALEVLMAENGENAIPSMGDLLKEAVLAAARRSRELAE